MDLADTAKQNLMKTQILFFGLSPALPSLSPALSGGCSTIRAAPRWALAPATAISDGRGTSVSLPQFPCCTLLLGSWAGAAATRDAPQAGVVCAASARRASRKERPAVGGPVPRPRGPSPAPAYGIARAGGIWERRNAHARPTGTVSSTATRSARCLAHAAPQTSVDHDGACVSSII